MSVRINFAIPVLSHNYSNELHKYCVGLPSRQGFRAAPIPPYLAREVKWQTRRLKSVAVGRFQKLQSHKFNGQMTALLEKTIFA